jgi:hypothetical protein
MIFIKKYFEFDVLVLDGLATSEYANHLNKAVEKLGA